MNLDPTALGQAPHRLGQDRVFAQPDIVGVEQVNPGQLWFEAADHPARSAQESRPVGVGIFAVTKIGQQADPVTPAQGAGGVADDGRDAAGLQVIVKKRDRFHTIDSNSPSAPRM